MKTAHEFLSLKKCNAQWIDTKIGETIERIQKNKIFMLTDIGTMRETGQDLLTLAELKDAALIVKTPQYKAYEASGKVVEYADFLASY